MYLTEWEEFNVSQDHDSLVWNKDLVYGDWTGGPNRDGSLYVSVDIDVPEVYLHVYTLCFVTIHSYYTAVVLAQCCLGF